MAVVTQMVREVSPIPPGRYWITVLSQNIRDFDDWLRDMQGAVRVETAELDTSGPTAAQFIIFRVPEGRMPFLNAVQFGFPNTAPPGVTSIQDVEQSPITPGALDVLQNAADSAASGFGSLAALVLLVLLLKS